MNEKQIEQRQKLLEDQLTLMVWLEDDFKKKLGNRGYQAMIDRILDEMLALRAKKKNL